MARPQHDLPGPEAPRPTGNGVEQKLHRLTQLAGLSWEDGLRELLQLDAQLLDVGRVSYWALQRDPMLLSCELGYIAVPGAFERGSVLTEAEYPCYFAELDRRIIHVADALRDPRTAEMRDYLIGRQVASLLDVPIRTGGGLCGVLCHEQIGALRHWTHTDIALATCVGQSLAAMLETRARNGAEQTERRAVFLDNAAYHVSASLDLQEIAERATRVAVPRLGDWALLDVEQDGQLVRKSFAHVNARGRAALAASRPTLTPRVVAARQTVIAHDLQDERLAAFGVTPESIAQLEAFGRRSIIAVPLFSGPCPMGAFVVGTAQRHYDDTDLRLTEEYARRVAAAITNARLHAEARAAVYARDEFISMAAHELHGPLASLRLAAEALAASEPAGMPAGARRLHDTILRQTERLTRLVDHMLDASRIGSHGITLDRAPVDLSALVRGVMQDLSSSAARAGSTLELHADPNVVGPWDAERLLQVLRNLLDNAIKFGRGRPIEVGVHGEPDQAVLTVRDHGCGVAEERLRTVFDPFVRAASPRQYGGLGLGLFIARSIVQAHGGTIDLQSRVDRGTTFTVRLPRE